MEKHTHINIDIYVMTYSTLTLEHHFLGTGTSLASLKVVVEFPLHIDMICHAVKDNNAPAYAVGYKRC